MLRAPSLALCISSLIPFAAGCAMSRGGPERGRGASEAAYGGAPAPSSVAADVAVVTGDNASSGQAAQAGRLTAGTFDDALNPGALASFAARVAGEEGLDRLATAMMEPFSVVTVVDREGRPVGGARVQGRLTGTDGRVVLFPADLGAAPGARAPVTVAYAGERVTTLVGVGDADARVQVAGWAAAPRALDLALVIDATGSMGDEIDYLKAELRGITESIAAAHPQIDARWALVAYRDHGDAYVTRRFDFSPRLRDLERALADQQASGGGDYPEAMDEALWDAAELSWREGPAARVLFLIADAPPHADRVDRAMGAVEALRGRGVAVYPVAASGAAEAAELVMRAAALTTGGQHLFLTDDSGIGDPHAEPHVPCYEVEALRDAMARAVVSELAGRRVEADPGRVRRRVGSGEGGVCTALARAI